MCSSDLHSDAGQSGPLDRAAGTDDLQMFQRVGSGGGQHRGSFGDIDRTTATESQDGIAARVSHQRHSGAHPLDRWLGRDSERNARDAGFAQRRPDGPGMQVVDADDAVQLRDLQVGRASCRERV